MAELAKHAVAASRAVRAAGASRAESASRPDRRWAFLIAVVAAAVYANALHGQFALDDNAIIAGNPLVHHASGVWRAFLHSYWPESAGAGQYRPLTMATFAADWALSGGAPAWLHAVNILWHVLACVLVWRLLADVVSSASAAVGASVFAVHPVHVEAVANLVGRSELLCGACVVGALLAHRHGRWAAVGLYAAALGAKESGIVFLGLAIASDLLLGGLGPAAARDAGADGRARRRHLYAGYAAVTVLYGVVLAILFRDQPLLRTAILLQHATPYQRWLTAATVIPEYVRLLAFPFRLHVEYGPGVIELATRITPAALVGLALTAAAIGLVVRTARRAPLVAFAICTFAIGIAPVANVLFPSGIVLAERTLYLPSLSVALIAAWVADRVATGASKGTARSRGDAPPRLAWVGWRLAPACVALAALALLAVRTWTRTPIWRDNKAVYLASLRGEPRSYVAHERMADVLGRSGDVAGGVREYATARALYPEDPMLYQAPAALLVGQSASGTRAANLLLDSAALMDRSAYADAMRRAWVRYAAGDYHGAIAWARDAYLMQRDSVDAIMVLTQAAREIDDVPDAAAAFRLALGDHPENRALHRSYAAMLAAIGDSGAARRQAVLGGGS